ncbi:hypothetical protein GCM10028806_28450 [Spirosoma terrae]|uniref:Dystroglycan-type cadherin-like domain-containing protein n=1 Tax=Spirosoma terrae TaxID=1968276 RepID=A0A6L9L9A6_9BACT|nr:putative Ig domain-containing protein [Spirosoma terrae]NDU97195.1 hypothetical protein [Spirosoma terrae]
MKARLFNWIGGLFLFLLATPSLLARSVPADTLPAGTKISLQIQLPGETQTTRITYTVPAPADVVTPIPEIPKPDNSVFYVVRSIETQTAVVNQPYTFSVPESTYNTSPSSVDVSDLPPGLRWNSQTRTISGTPTQTDIRTITVSASKDGKLVQTKFILDVVDRSTGAPVKPQPDRDDNTVPPPAPTAYAERKTVPFVFSSKPNVINRMQAQTIPDYQDGWRMKTSDIVVGGNDGKVETPDELRKRGHSDFNALWFYGDEGMPSWGLPKSTDRLFYEYTGNFWGPWHQTAYLSVIDDFDKIVNTTLSRMPAWNTSTQNGLIDGVPTVKLGHFNIEYNWFLQSDWDKLSQDQRNVQYWNYALNRRESLQDTYNRGGIDAIQQAQHQKWRNIIAISVMYLDRNNPGMKHFYGDMHGLTVFKSLTGWNHPLSPTDFLTADVNNAGLYPEANETANHGLITLWNGQVYNVSGNLNLINGHRHTYHYEWEFFMKRKDYEEYFSITKDSPADKKDIRQWYDKFYPNLARPYELVYHILSNWSIEQRKGWAHMPLEFQTEPIFEQFIRDKDNYQVLNGSWVPWTLNAQNQRPTKVPVHPEISEYITIYSRMHYDGKFMWGLGCCSRINPAEGQGDNVNPNVHQVAREAEQLALTELGQYNNTVFLADKRQHIGDIPIYNPNTKQYVTGNPDQLLKAAGGPVPLVTAVDSPSSGWELYAVYFPHAERNQESTVRWKSPIDGAELSGNAHGWSVRLYARKR